MSSEFQNYVPIQGLIGVSGIISSIENLSESSEVDNEGDANPTETMSESVVVTVV